MSEKFNPYDSKYKKIEDLPADQQENFRKNLSSKKGVGYYEDGFVKQGVLREDDSQEQATRIQEIIKNGQALNYTDAEVHYEQEKCRENLHKAKEYIKLFMKGLDKSIADITCLQNIFYYLNVAGENVLAEKICLEVIPGAGIMNAKKALLFLGEEGLPDEDRRTESFDIIGHQINKLANESNFRDTDFYISVARFIADLAILQEDFRYNKLYNKIGDVGKFQEMEKLKDSVAPKSGYSVPDGYYEAIEKRNKSIERVDAFRKRILSFIDEIKDMSENKIDIINTLTEIDKEIDNKLEQEK
jgi:hypothetical protein